MGALGDLVNAISLGVIYAVVAVSVGLVFGVLRQVNLAQGEIIAFGAYSLWLTRTWPIILIFALCCLICIGMSLAMQIAIFRPLRGASALTTLIVTFGLSYALEAVWLMVFGPNGQPVSRLSVLNNTIVGGHVDNPLDYFYRDRNRWSVLHFLVNRALSYQDWCDDACYS